MVVTKTCRVCGKEYKYCRKTTVPKGIFNYRDVACSPECGSIYLERVAEARAARAGQTPIQEVSATEEAVAEMDEASTDAQEVDSSSVTASETDSNANDADVNDEEDDDFIDKDDSFDIDDDDESESE